MFTRETLQTDWETHITRPNNVLDLEVGEFRIEAELLDDASILARCKLAVIFAPKLEVQSQ
jgi:hypothetical protein